MFGRKPGVCKWKNLKSANQQVRFLKIGKFEALKSTNHPSNLFSLLLFGSVDAVYTARVEDVLPEQIDFESSAFVCHTPTD